MILISFAVSRAGNMAGIINMGAILEDLYQSPGTLTCSVDRAFLGGHFWKPNSALPTVLQFLRKQKLLKRQKNISKERKLQQNK